jgi:hypothetical protein
MARRILAPETFNLAWNVTGGPGGSPVSVNSSVSTTDPLTVAFGLPTSVVRKTPPSSASNAPRYHQLTLTAL